MTTCQYFNQGLFWNIIGERCPSFEKSQLQGGSSPVMEFEQTARRKKTLEDTSFEPSGNITMGHFILQISIDIDFALLKQLLENLIQSNIQVDSTLLKKNLFSLSDIREIK